MYGSMNPEKVRNAPWLDWEAPFCMEDRDAEDGPYPFCLLCWSWANEGHMDCVKHIKRVKKWMWKPYPLEEVPADWTDAARCVPRRQQDRAEIRPQTRQRLVLDGAPGLQAPGGHGLQAGAGGVFPAGVAAAHPAPGLAPRDHVAADPPAPGKAPPDHLPATLGEIRTLGRDLRQQLATLSNRIDALEAAGSAAGSAASQPAPPGSSSAAGSAGSGSSSAGSPCSSSWNREG